VTHPTPSPLRASLPADFRGGPEYLFRTHRMVHEDGAIRASMTTGSWLTGPDGQACAGSLGILADDVLGTAIAGPGSGREWSVSTEIAVEFCAPVPLDGSRLHGEARLRHVDQRTGLSSGQIVDDAGQLVALCSQRGRFVAGATPTASASATGSADPGELGATDLLSLLGADPGFEFGSARLSLTAGGNLLNPLGNLHGGISLCASELVGASSMARPDAPLVTASIRIMYLRPVARGTVLTYTSTVRHRGRTLAVAQVEGTDPAGRICTLATVTGHAPTA
jgi:uncharacterized protein (TIGR00369 family)